MLLSIPYIKKPYKNPLLPKNPLLAVGGMATTIGLTRCFFEARKARIRRQRYGHVFIQFSKDNALIFYSVNVGVGNDAFPKW